MCVRRHSGRRRAARGRDQAGKRPGAGRQERSAVAGASVRGGGNTTSGLPWTREQRNFDALRMTDWGCSHGSPRGRRPLMGLRLDRVPWGGAPSGDAAPTRRVRADQGVPATGGDNGGGRNGGPMTRRPGRGHRAGQDGHRDVDDERRQAGGGYAADEEQDRVVEGDSRAPVICDRTAAARVAPAGRRGRPRWSARGGCPPSDGSPPSLRP